MTSAEMRSYRKQQLNNRLAEKYRSVIIHDKPYFLNKNGTLFRLDSMGGNYNCLLIEYADSLQEALLYRFEDGDLFYMDDMTEDEMFEAMVREIENG